MLHPAVKQAAAAALTVPEVTQPRMSEWLHPPHQTPPQDVCASGRTQEGDSGTSRSPAPDRDGYSRSRRARKGHSTAWAVKTARTVMSGTDGLGPRAGADQRSVSLRVNYA